MWHKVGKRIMGEISEGLDVDVNIDNLFRLFDKDDSEALDAKEIFKGMSKLGWGETLNPKP